jgi:tRNA A-37 threonylcarbamoyl transferase component Bud32
MMTLNEPHQLGKTGKEGTVYLEKYIVDGKETDCAKKVFKSGKSVNRVQREAKFQNDAASYDVAPKIYNIDLSNPPSITMEKMDKTIIEILKEQNGSLTDKQQKDILNLYQKLDNNGLLHNDANPLNLMIKGNEWKLIDYGFSKKITKKHGQYPNLNISLNLLLNSMNGLITRKYLIESPLILLNALENKCY